MVDTSAASPHMVSPWRQEHALASQCKMHYHHCCHYYHEKWKSYNVWRKVLSPTTLDSRVIILVMQRLFLWLSGVIRSISTENKLSQTKTPQVYRVKVTQHNNKSKRSIIKPESHMIRPENSPLVGPSVGRHAPHRTVLECCFFCAMLNRKVRALLLWAAWGQWEAGRAAFGSFLVFISGSDIVALSAN